MLILEDLWNGAIVPSERNYAADSEYSQIRRRMIEQGKKLRSRLSAEENAVFEQFSQEQTNLVRIAEQDAFAEGVRFGVKFILDALEIPAFV